MALEDFKYLKEMRDALDRGETVNIIGVNFVQFGDDVEVSDYKQGGIVVGSSYKKKIDDTVTILDRKFQFPESKTLEQFADEHAIGFVNWLTSEKSKYSVMYGNQEKRFANFDDEYTVAELLEIYKSLNA